MRDLDYLKLLAKQFPTATAAGAEMINLRAICALPKGTEYFFSDLHGESDAFIYLMRSASGIVRDKIDETFGNLLPEEEQLELANLIYYPRDILSNPAHKAKDTPEWQRITINRLVNICRCVSSKYTRSKVRKKMPQQYAYAIDELLHLDSHDEDKRGYLRGIMDAIIDIDMGDDFIVALSELIQNLVVDNLHIIGDVFDRGPHADQIMEATIRSASPSTTAVLPTPGSPIRHGLFFVRLDRIWTTRMISRSRPITGSSLPSAAIAVRSRAY